MHVSSFTTVIVFEPEVTECQRAYRSAQPSADGPHDGRRCAVPQHPRRRHARRHRNTRHNYGCGTAGNTADPDYSCLRDTATHGHDRPLFDNSTRSAINDIAGLTDGQLPYILPQTQVLSVILLNR